MEMTGRVYPRHKANDLAGIHSNYATRCTLFV